MYRCSSTDRNGRFFIYNIYESKQPKQEVTVDYSAIASLSQSLSDNGTSAE